MIYEQKNFTNDDGVNIFGLYPQAGPSFGVPSFRATGQLQFKHPSGEILTVQFPVNIPGVTPEQAFNNFPLAFEAAKNEALAEMQHQQQHAASQIVVLGRGFLAPGGRA